MLVNTWSIVVVMALLLCFHCEGKNLQFEMSCEGLERGSYVELNDADESKMGRNPLKINNLYFGKGTDSEKVSNFMESDVNDEFGNDENNYKGVFSELPKENNQSKRKKRNDINKIYYDELAAKYEGVFGGYPQENGQSKRVKRKL